jgi:hypothetical protein
MFAESFYNSKDIVFMAAMAIAIYTMTRLIAAPRLALALIHGAITGFAIDVRIIGILIAAATVTMLAIRLLKSELSPKQAIICTLGYLAATATFVVALFPFLWEDPLGHFLFALGNMARFRWGGYVLYLGQVYNANELPWHYLPIWIVVTTPPSSPP